MRKQKGFTLVELLVAMGIIAVLVTLSIVAISIVQRSLRNTQRKDVGNTFRLWIADYKNINGTYPETGSFSVSGGGITHDTDGLVVETSGATTPLTESTNEGTSSGTPYCYRTVGPSADPTGFSLRVGLEPSGLEEFGETDGTHCWPTNSAYRIQ